MHKGYVRLFTSLLVFWGCFCFGQELKITGSIKDSINTKPIPLASIVLYRYNTNQIIDYTSSSENGDFQLKTLVEKGIYSLKARHLGYHPVEKQILISENPKENLRVDFELIPKLNHLEEIVLKTAPPILVKKDTIILSSACYSENGFEWEGVFYIHCRHF